MNEFWSHFSLRELGKFRYALKTCSESEAGGNILLSLSCVFVDVATFTPSRVLLMSLPL